MAQRTWSRPIWLHTLLIQESIIPYAYHPEDFPSLNKMWKRPRSRRCWTEALSSHARVAGPAQ